MLTFLVLRIFLLKLILNAGLTFGPNLLTGLTFGSDPLYTMNRRRNLFY